jgi:D-sedoheptulose 7-phosphate isomerase
MAFETEVITYISRLQRLLEKIDAGEVSKVAEVLLDAYEKGRGVFIIGNGGSAATASHFACDLVKTVAKKTPLKFRVQSLTDNVPWMTAISNDASYEEVFIEQLEHCVEPGDVVVAISASGKSPSILRAVTYAREIGAMCIAFVGFEGGPLQQLSHLSLWVSCKEYGPVEDIHLIFEHILTDLIRRHLCNKEES